MLNSRFSYAVTDLNIRRSKFEIKKRKIGGFNSGFLVPIGFFDILPGDTLSLDIGSFIRMSTPIKPVLDNCYLDLTAFFCPYRLVWDKFRQFMGELPSDPYEEPIEYSIPQLTGGRPLLVSDDDNIVNQWNNFVPFDTCLDSLGVPAGTTVESVSALPFRAVALIWNEYFRAQTLQNAANVDISSVNQDMFTPAELNSSVIAGNVYELQDDYWVDSLQRGGPYPPVNKYHDYFTSALREAQRGDPVPIPLSGFAPVYPIDEFIYNDVVGSDSRSTAIVNASGNLQSGYSGGIGVNAGKMVKESLSSSTTTSGINFGNLIADLGLNKQMSDYSGLYSTINDLRYANAMQSLLEAENRYGTRYREIIRGVFQVDAPEGELQVPEFLGSATHLINMNQVLQTSASSEGTTPQGNTAAYSVTANKDSLFTKSFTEHGIVLIFASVRVKHSYQQALNKYWTKKNKFDFYNPYFANLPEQPIYNYEIYNSDQSRDSTDTPSSVRNWTEANEVFGYNEAWAEYREFPDETFSVMRSNYRNGSLDIWHYADFYESQPYLSSEWIREDTNLIERTLADRDFYIPQFLCEFNYKGTFVRPIPMFSIPAMESRF